MVLSHAVPFDWVGMTVAALLLSAMAVAAVALVAGRHTARAGAEGAAAPAGPRPPDRRKSPRRAGGAAGVLVSDADFRTEPVPAQLLDCSMDGMKLLLPRPVTAGALLGVRPNYPPGVAGAVVVVKHCHPEGERWVAGCQFLETPPWDTLARLLG